MLLSLLVFGAVIPGEFVVDDQLWGSSDHSTQESRAVVAQMGSWVFRPFQAGLMQVGLRIFGPNPSAWHGLSIFLHGINGFLLFLVLLRLLPAMDWRWALASSWLFLLHPAGSEGVLWISAMSEVTVLMAMLLVLNVYLRWRETSWSMPRLGAFGVMALAACLFKETALMLLPLLLVFEFVQQSRQHGRQRWGPLVVLAGSALAFIALRQWVLGPVAGGQPLNLDFRRIAELLLAHFRFLWLPAAPPFALRPPEVPLASAVTVWLATGVFLLLLVAGKLLRVSRAGMALGVAWGLFGLWPAVAVALVGEGFFNGRQAYVPAVGAAIIVATCLERLMPVHRRVALPAVAALLGWMAYATIQSAMAWRSNTEIYRQSMRVSPAAPGPRAGIAASLAARGDVDGAITMYRGALDRATTPAMRSSYLYNMASVLGQAGRAEESDVLLRELLSLDPANSFAWTGLGNNAWSAGRLAEAAGHYRRALQLAPDNQEAASNLAALLKATKGSF